MKRYVVCTILGDGTEDNSYRAAVADYTPTWTMSVSPTQTSGGPRWVLVVASATAAMFATMDALPDIDVLPFGPESLDAMWMSLGTSQQRNQLASAIQARCGVTIARDDPRALRAIITDVGVAVDPNFSARNLDVIDTYL